MKYKSKCQYVKIGGKTVAAVRGSLLDIRKHSGHIRGNPPAIGIAVETIRQAEQMGVTDIQVTIFETGQLYTCTLDHFRNFSFEQSLGGFEPQKFLPLDYWIASLEQNSTAPKAGEIRTGKGNGKKVRNPRGLLKSLPAPKIEQLSLLG
jgi:hypothetical protein